MIRLEAAAGLLEAMREIADDTRVRTESWEGDYRWCQERARRALRAMSDDRPEATSTDTKGRPSLGTPGGKPQEGNQT